jgi:hypothetical protein
MGRGESMTDEIDYTAMNGPELLRACGDSGAKWAEAFCQHAKALSFYSISQERDWIEGWFANAIESSHDLRMRRTLERNDHDPHLG